MPAHTPDASPTPTDREPARRSSTAISRLRREHGNIDRVLSFLESELARLNGGEDIDDALVLDAFTYLTEYVDRCHHAREDVAVELLAARSRTVSELRPVLAAQHEALRGSGTSLRKRLESALLDEPVARHEIARDGSVYTRELRQNMALEEEFFFNVATSLMSEEDWTAIDAQLGAHTDPLFGELIEDRFRELAEELAQRAGCAGGGG